MVSLFARIRNIVLPFAVAAAAVIAISLGIVLLGDVGNSDSNAVQNPTATPAVLDSSQTPVPTP